jgi:hypothetical protein
VVEALDESGPDAVPHRGSQQHYKRGAVKSGLEDGEHVRDGAVLGDAGTRRRPVDAGGLSTSFCGSMNTTAVSHWFQSIGVPPFFRPANVEGSLIHGAALQLKSSVIGYWSSWPRDSRNARPRSMSCSSLA